ncbi:S8 family peptidase [Staphylococcus hominis]|uniref:S8 family peptidase n=1 Tax=Staphylococcus hominis TaxID=1290 RepID=UPI002878F800|nr:S8 family serine peptidase [Staphylococcus hominis]MDS3918867.1 S8 family serine peptidase [Staphylococcus hominis]
MKKLLISIFLITTLFLICNFQVQAKEYKILLNEDVNKNDKNHFLEKYKIKENPIDYYTINTDNESDLKNEKVIKQFSNNSDMTFVKPSSSIPRNSNNKSEKSNQRNINYTSSDLWDKQWDVKKVTNNGHSFSKYKPSDRTTIAVIDSGIDKNHIELKGSIKEGSKNFVPKGGYNGEEKDEDGNPNNVQDKTGHGTAVASQISANKNIKGVAPGLKVRSYRVFGQKSAKADWITNAIIQAADDNNDVINLSTGQYLMKNGSYKNGGNDNIDIKAYNRAINYAFKKGTVVVSALGNDGLNINSQKQMSKHLSELISPKDSIIKKGKVYDYPSQNKKVISVGGTDYNDNLSDFSNHGKNSFDILSPAGSTRNLNKVGLNKFQQNKYYEKDWIFVATPNDTYQYVYGNSFAAPKVSATLGLIIDKYHYKNHPNKSINHLLRNNNDNAILNVDNNLSDSCN